MLRKGSHVVIVFEGRAIEGRVIIVSENQKSLMLGFDAMLGGYIGMMPVVDNREGYIDLIEGKPVDVREVYE